ncbi:MAG: TonB-dependent receptor, partial [Flavobacteriales bacterium]|nr:TonB-dependent receptor [Flavobacteriales bacterium]
ATVKLENTPLGAISDVDGKFFIERIQPGTYNVNISLLNFLSTDLFNVVITNGNTNTFTVELERSSEQMNTLEIKRYTYGKATETPLSVQSLTAEEIRSNPGGNFDISKVIQALPGVGGLSGAGERNDLLIRGGAPSENVYYLDGIEVPQINHFSTQGSSGGPQGIINV